MQGVTEVVVRNGRAHVFPTAPEKETNGVPFIELVVTESLPHLQPLLVVCFEKIHGQSPTEK